MYKFNQSFSWNKHIDIPDLNFPKKVIGIIVLVFLIGMVLEAKEKIKLVADTVDIQLN